MLVRRAALEDPSLAEEALLALAVRTRDPRLRRHVAAAHAEWARACPGEPLRGDLRAAVEALSG